MSSPATLDLPAYLQRIGYTGSLQPSYGVLEGPHLAHSTHIPFENLDILLGRPIRLDLESLQAKLVKGLRGGYCFEHNLLFSAILQQLGFSVTQLAARVRVGTSVTPPRTHMSLLVSIEGSAWLADVGFGGNGLLGPVPFGSGLEIQQFAWTYRVVQKAGLWVLQSLRGDTWSDMYAFTLEPQELVDHELANYYTSTHPTSRFVLTLTAQLPAPDMRRALRGWELVEDTGQSMSSRRLSGDAELLEVLAGTFGLRFPPDTRFQFRDAVP